MTLALAGVDLAYPSRPRHAWPDPAWGGIEAVYAPSLAYGVADEASLSQPNRSRTGSVVVLTGRTPMTSREARRHLELAYLAVIREAPESKTLSLLMAQWALETGRGQSMWGFNFGGIKATSGGVWFVTSEFVGGMPQRVHHRFRTYSSAIEGAKHYIQTLAFDFPKAFAALQSGCAEQFVHALSDERYFSGDPTAYCKAIASLADEFEQRWSAESAAPSNST